MSLRCFIAALCFLSSVYGFTTGPASAQEVAAAPPVMQERARFFVSIQDLPLMPGLEELPQQTVIFDKPEGRIIESAARIESGSPDAVEEFYVRVLPQLGWVRVSGRSFVREGEQMDLHFETHEGHNFLNIMVRPVEGGNR